MLDICDHEGRMSDLQLRLGQTHQLTGTAYDANGHAISAEVVWSVDDAQVLTVSLTGLVTAVGYGITTVAASYGNKSTSIDVVVVQAALAVPAYYPAPGAMWTELASDRCSLVVLTANVAQATGDGYGEGGTPFPPGSTAREETVAAIAAVRATGAKVFGYVSTQNGDRAVANVCAEVDIWFVLYAVDGIFFDEIATSNQWAQYLASISSYVRDIKQGFVIFNPGYLTPDEYVMDLCDVLVNYEDTFANYTTKTIDSTTDWIYRYPPERFWHLVHTCAEIDWPTAWEIAKLLNAGNIYVTEQVMPAPYGQLASYHADERDYEDGFPVAGVHRLRDYIRGGILDYAAADCVQGDSGLVSRLYDLGPYGHDLAQSGADAAKPVASATGANGHPSLTFDGAQWLDSVDAVEAQLKCTVWAVVKTTSAAVQCILTGQYAEFGLLFAANKQPAVRGPTYVPSADAVPSDTWCCAVAICTGYDHNSQLWVNGVRKSSVAGGAYHLLYAALGGQYGSGASGLVGEVAAGGVFNHALGYEELGNLFAWAAAEFGTPNGMA
jgi:hypothetical protein